MVQKDNDIFILYSTQYLVTHLLRDKVKDKNRNRAIAQVVSRRLPTAASWVDPRSISSGHAVVWLVEALCYKSEGRGFGSQ
jgi:hypothetical protein